MKYLCIHICKFHSIWSQLIGLLDTWSLTFPCSADYLSYFRPILPSQSSRCVFKVQRSFPSNKLSHFGQRPRTCVVPLLSRQADRAKRLDFHVDREFSFSQFLWCTWGLSTFSIVAQWSFNATCYAVCRHKVSALCFVWVHTVANWLRTAIKKCTLKHFLIVNGYKTQRLHSSCVKIYNGYTNAGWINWKISWFVSSMMSFMLHISSTLLQPYVKK